MLVTSAGSPDPLNLDLLMDTNQLGKRSRGCSARVEPLRAGVSTSDAWRGAFFSGTKAGVVRDSTLSEGQFERRLVAQPTRQRKMAGKIMREEAMRRWEKGETIHRRELPEPPKRHEDLASHPLEELFLRREVDHLKSHVDVGTWERVRFKTRRAVKTR